MTQRAKVRQFTGGLLFPAIVGCVAIDSIGQVYNKWNQRHKKFQIPGRLVCRALGSKYPKMERSVWGGGGGPNPG